MNRPCPHRNLCPENPFENLSSEDFDIDHYFCYASYPGPPPGAGRNWSTDDCGGCTVLQGPVSCVADSNEECGACTILSELTCGDPPQNAYVDANCNPLPIYCNVDTPCTVDYPDGRHYTYTLPAGSVCAPSQELADQIAQSTACNRAHNRPCPFTQIPRCTCVGGLYVGEFIDSDESAAGFTLHVDAGQLPPGLHVVGRELIGTPTTSGTYVFTIEAWDARNNICSMLYTISVIRITTTSLLEYEIGTAYAYQLSADGGSGNYAWNIEAGTLPDGLSLSSSGLISGTPTNNNGSASIEFNVVDLTCEAAERSKYPPRVTMSTVSTTTIKTRRGFLEYVPSTGDLYKTITWTGEATQVQNVLRSILDGGDAFGGGARWVYSGASSIDIHGNYTSHHRKDMFVACNNQPWPESNINYSPFMLLFGYCWADDPSSCASCVSDSSGWEFSDDWASDSPYDTVWMLNMGPAATLTPTTLSYNDAEYNPGGFGGFPVVIDGVNTPTYGLAGINAHWFGMFNKRNYSATLSDPYTDAEAEASKLVYQSNGKAAENLPNYQTFTENYVTSISSRVTSCEYTLHCEHLIPGSNYRATVTFLNNLGGAASRSVDFIATAETHDIVDTVPTPTSGRTTTVRNPRLIAIPLI